MNTSAKKVKQKEISNVNTKRLLRLINENKIFIGLLALIVISTILSPHFLTVRNLFNVLKGTTVVATIAIGMTYVILSGGIDLSTGTMVAFISCTGGLMLLSGMGTFTTILVLLLLGTVVGVINGILIQQFKLEPFIVTMGTSVVLNGLALVIPNGRTVIVSDMPASFSVLSNGYIGAIPVPVIIVAILYIIFYFILNNTTFGRYIYAIGSNEDATRLSGISTYKNKVVIYAISGLLAAFAGILYLSRVSVGEPTAGANFPLDAIAAVVVGGTRFTGAIGGVGSTVIGVIFIGLINNILNLVGVSPYMQLVVRGLIILCAVVAGAPKKNEG